MRANHVRAAPSDAALLAEIAQAEQRVRDDARAFPEEVRVAVRDALRARGYKPTGRGKPASELLLAFAQKEGLPRIGNLVDINNLTSLESALPISIFDLDLLGETISTRYGEGDERYVFNASGQSMELAGLPVVCRGETREPVGNAVRDAMSCKVHAQTTRVLAIAYAPAALPASTLLATCERLASRLAAHADARDVTVAMVPR